MVEFEFDPTKSVVNQEKHGIDFVRAQELAGFRARRSARPDDGRGPVAGDRPH